MERRCSVKVGDSTQLGLCHGFGFKAWTHGAAVTVGGFPAGQESHAVAIVELSDGTLQEVPLGHVTMLDGTWS